MATPLRIGLYLTDDKIVLAESTPKKLQKIISSPITASLDPSKDVPFHSDITEEIHLVGTFQKILRENKIDLNQVCVSIPIKEVFLRSFVLPWMPANELNNVVFYEIKKYVPFDLKLLDYVYQAVTFVEDKQKRVRIIFYAVRKQTLEKYERILKQIGGKVVVYEPAPVSLAKQLVAQNHLKLDQRVAVIYTQDNYGQIVFYEKGISYFVREFVLSGADDKGSKDSFTFMREQLLVEIRKSFEYYNRQFSPEKINDVVLLSSLADKELSTALNEALSVKIRIVESSVSVGLQKFVGMDVLCASGSCIAKTSSVLSEFNFLLAKAMPSSKGAAPALVSQFLAWKVGDFLYALQAAVVCIFLLGGGFVYSRLKLEEIKKEHDRLTKLEGDLANKTVEEIDADIIRNNTRVGIFKKILEDRSRMASALVGLTKALPEGVWLENIDVRYLVGGRISLELKGYVYLAETGAQFKSVNEFVSHLEADKNFPSIKFKVNSKQRRQLNGYDVVNFAITGI